MGRKGIYVLVVLFIVASLLVVWLSRSDSGPDQETMTDLSIPAGVEFSQVQLVGRNQGERQWELTSGQMRTEGDFVFLHALQHGTILQGEEPKYHIEASRGVWDRKNDSLSFFENVVLQEQDGFQLWTAKMIWEAQAKQLWFYGDTVVEF